MQYSVIGDANQSVVAQLTLGDEIRAEVTALVMLSDGIALEAALTSGTMRVAELPAPNSSVQLTLFRCQASTGVVGFAAPYSGEIRELPLKGANWYCARDAFLFCSRDVRVNVGYVESIEHGYFQSGGFVLYKLSGFGESYIHCGGNVIEYELTQGQRVTVDLGCIAAMQDTVQFTLERFSDIPNAQGGVENLYLMTLTGPGRIFLATLPLSRMSQAISPVRVAPLSRTINQSPDGTLSDLVREL